MITVFDFSGLPSPRKLQQIIKKLTPKQFKLIQANIVEASAQFRRSQFKLIRGRGRKSK